MTVFFQNCHRSPRVPVQEKHWAHPWIQQCTWGVERGCFLDLPLNQNMKPEWLVEMGSYWRNGRKARAWVAKRGCLREVCPKFLNSNWGHSMMSRRNVKVWRIKKETGIWGCCLQGLTVPWENLRSIFWAGSSKRSGKQLLNLDDFTHKTLTHHLGFTKSCMRQFLDMLSWTKMLQKIHCIYCTQGLEVYFIFLKKDIIDLFIWLPWVLNCSSQNL